MHMMSEDERRWLDAEQLEDFKQRIAELEAVNAKLNAVVEAARRIRSTIDMRGDLYKALAALDGGQS